MSEEHKYEVWAWDLEKNLDKINKGEPVKISVRSVEDYSWKVVEAKIAQETFEGSEPLALIIDEGGGMKDKGKWHIKILKELDEDELVRKPTG